MFESLNLNEITKLILRKKFKNLKKGYTKNELYERVYGYCEALLDTEIITREQFKFLRKLMLQIYKNRDFRKKLFPPERNKTFILLR